MMSVRPWEVRSCCFHLFVYFYGGLLLTLAELGRAQFWRGCRIEAPPLDLVQPEPYFIQFQFNIGSSLSILSISIRLARQGQQADKVQKSTPLIISKLFLLIVSIQSLEKKLCQKLNYYKNICRNNDVGSLYFFIHENF